jgi:hypothetical protein
MKKLPRSTQGDIDYLKSFADYSSRQRIAQYSDEAIRAFGDVVQKSLESSVQAEHRIRGLRAESLFLVAVAGIGEVALIKEEDKGDVVFNGDDIQVPDYRVVRSDGHQLLIEVKAVHMEDSLETPLKLSDSCIQRLRRYASLTQTDLRIAVFWEEMSTWTLNSLDAFAQGRQGESKWTLDFARAITTNEMRTLGDRTIATLAPLRLRVHVDPEQSDPMPSSDATMKVVIAGVELLSQDRVLSGPAAQIAWKLIWYGHWGEVDQELHVQDGRLLWIDNLIGPPEWDDHRPAPGAPVFVSALSEMISRVYLRGASNTVHSTADPEALEPGYMGTFLPEDLASLDNLPLYLLDLLPNFDLVPGVNTSH